MQGIRNLWVHPKSNEKAELSPIDALTVIDERGYTHCIFEELLPGSHGNAFEYSDWLCKQKPSSSDGFTFTFKGLILEAPSFLVITREMIDATSHHLWNLRLRQQQQVQQVHHQTQQLAENVRSFFSC